MIWLSLKVSEYSGMLPARYTPARLSEFDLTRLQMLCHYPSLAKFCILRYSHMRGSERAQVWWKRGCEGMPDERGAPGLCCPAPALAGGSHDSQNIGQGGDHPFNTVIIYSLPLKHREWQYNSISNDKVTVKKNFCTTLILKQRTSKQPAVIFCVNV